MPPCRGWVAPSSHRHTFVRRFVTSRLPGGYLYSCKRDASCLAADVLSSRLKNPPPSSPTERTTENEKIGIGWVLFFVGVNRSCGAGEGQGGKQRACAHDLQPELFRGAGACSAGVEIRREPRRIRWNCRAPRARFGHLARSCGPGPADSRAELPQ